jgi:hypothetical protein
MFESRAKLEEDAGRLLESLRRLAEGRYAALFDARGVLLESPDGGGEGGWRLRRLVQSSAEALFRLPPALHASPGASDGGRGQGEAPLVDLFEAWEDDEFFLAFLNGRVGILVACPDAKRLQEESGRLLTVFADRLLRYNPAWRLDEKGRGLFFGSPRLDTVVIGRAEESG